MRSIRDPGVLARMETAFDLYDLAEQMMRQNLRRRFPWGTDEEIEVRLTRWLQKRPYEGPFPDTDADQDVQRPATTASPSPLPCPGVGIDDENAVKLNSLG